MPRHSKRLSSESVDSSKSPLTPVLPDGQFENAQIKQEESSEQYAAVQKVPAKKVETPIILSQPKPRRYRLPGFDFSHLAPENPRLDQDLRIDGQPKRPANSFLIFSRWRRKNPGNDFNDISKSEWSSVIGEEWNFMGEERKNVWNGHYNRLRLEFDNLYPDYKFTRVPNRPRSGSNRSLDPKAKGSPVGGIGPNRPSVRSYRSASTSHGSLSPYYGARRSSDTQLPASGTCSGQNPYYSPSGLQYQQGYPIQFDQRQRYPSYEQSRNSISSDQQHPVHLHPNNAFYYHNHQVSQVHHLHQQDSGSPNLETGGNESSYYAIEGPRSRAEGLSPSHLSAQLEGFRFPGFSEEEDQGPYSALAVIKRNPISRPGSTGVHSDHSDGTCNPSEISLSSQ